MENQKECHEFSRNIEKYVRNAVSNVVSSQCVVVMNAPSMLLSSMDTIVKYFFANWLEEYYKNGQCKNGRHWLTKHIKRYERKLRYRALPMMQSECGRVSHSSEKERRLSLFLSLDIQQF